MFDEGKGQDLFLRALIRGWALINFLGFQGGRLFEVGAYSKVGAYSNKYGIATSDRMSYPFLSLFILTDQYLLIVLLSASNLLCEFVSRSSCEYCISRSSNLSDLSNTVLNSFGISNKVLPGTCD